MNLFIPVEEKKSDFKIDYQSKLMFIGSCFAENISKRFFDLKFNVQTNPFGILYNPLSIERAIQNICENRIFLDEDVFLDFRNKDYWHCWQSHGIMSKKNKVECVNGLNFAIKKSREFLQNASVVFVTLGSAFVYFLKENGLPVANCHRQDANLFERKLISVDTTAQALLNIVQNLQVLNKNIQIVFTVSPLRHLSDGIHNNTLSKSTLHLAIENVLQELKKMNLNNVSYFASYEIVMDELRDYRFYADDMIHLSKIAENIIFERMQQTYMDYSTIENIKRVEKFMKSVNHKIIDKDSPKSIEFAKIILEQVSFLESQIPGLNLNQEKVFLVK